MPDTTTAVTDREVSITIPKYGTTLSGWSNLEINRGIDTGANGFSFSVPWEPTEENKRLFTAYQPVIVDVRLGNETLIKGRMEQIAARYSTNTKRVNIQGRSVSGSVVDGAAGPPFQFDQQPFNSIAEQLAKGPEGQFPVTDGVNVYAVPNITIPGLEIDPGQTVYEVLSKLASAQNLFALPQANGSLKFGRLDSRREPVASLVEGKAPLKSMSTNMDITKRFYKYVVIENRDGEASSSEAVDTGVDNRIRWTKVVRPQQGTPSLDEAAKFARSKALISSYTASATVTGWEHDGQTWDAGDIIMVFAPSAFVFNTSRLIVKNATLQFDSNGGKQTRLDLALPELYDGSDVRGRPWSP